MLRNSRIPFWRPTISNKNLECQFGSNGRYSKNFGTFHNGFFYKCKSIHVLDVLDLLVLICPIIFGVAITVTTSFNKN